MTDLTVFRTTAPEIVSFCDAYFTGSQQYSDAIEDFMVAVNVEYPVNGGVRVPAFYENVFVGVATPTQPLAMMEGWEPSPIEGCWVPDEKSTVGRRWLAKMDALPASPEELSSEALRMPMHLDLDGPQGSFHVHPTIYTSFEWEDEMAVFLVIPARLTRDVIPKLIAEFGGEQYWSEMLRSDWYLRLEECENREYARVHEAAKTALADLIAKTDPNLAVTPTDKADD